MKQKVLKVCGAYMAETEINDAISMGWYVQSVTTNSSTDMWIIILIKQ